MHKQLHALLSAGETNQIQRPTLVQCSIISYIDIQFIDPQNVCIDAIGVVIVWFYREIILLCGSECKQIVHNASI